MTFRPLLFQPSNLQPLDILRYMIFGMEEDNANSWINKITIWDLFSWIASLAIIVGGVLPYIPQYVGIKKSKNADGFSLYVCFTLLIANVLRILFWFGSYYEIPLLIQSIVMNLTMLAIIQLCVDTNKKNQIIRGKDKIFTDGTESYNVTLWDFDSRYFWKWTDFRSYVEFVATFALFFGLLTYIFIDSSVYFEALGFASLLVEAMLGLPQFYDNFLSKSTYGMSRAMVFLWLTGDSFKTIYFIARKTPIQFIMCGSLQIAVDLAILSQTVWYGTSPGRRKHSEVSK